MSSAWALLEAAWWLLLVVAARSLAGCSLATLWPPLSSGRSCPAGLEGGNLLATAQIGQKWATRRRPNEPKRPQNGRPIWVWANCAARERLSGLCSAEACVLLLLLQLLVVRTSLAALSD